MLLRTRLTVLFAGITGCILLICSISVYFFSSRYRGLEFEERLQQKIEATARLYADIDEVDARLLRIIQQQELGVLPNEQIQIFSIDGEEVYRSDEIRYFEVPKEFVSIVISNGIDYTRIGIFEVFGKIYKGKSGTFIVVGGGYDKFGLSKLRNLRNVLVLVTLGGILIFFISGWIYTGRALKPISGLISQAENMTPENLKARLDEGNGKDELARMAKAFNLLFERIEAAFKLQKTFVANASHELRTPLTIITGQLEVLLLKPRNEEEYKLAVEAILDDIKRLNRITNALLLLAQTEKNRSELPINHVRIDEILWQVRSELMKSHSEYEVKVSFIKQPKEESDFAIEGSELLIRTALINIAENACKFSKNKTAIISLDYDGNTVIIICEDHGIGISENEMKLLFQPFFRSTAVTAYQGHGLGLALVDKIIKLHSGTIRVESVVGEFTRFEIKLNHEYIR
ncbi:MAG: ATP-binding protein [Bacteroidia bacterium]